MDSTGGGGGSACASPKVSNNNSAFDALTLQTIQDQQHIIERQRELVATLKTRVEELEAHQLRHSNATAIATTHHGVGSSGSYAAEARLQRRIQSIEAENAALKECAAGLRDDLVVAAEHLQTQQLAKEREEAAWKEKVDAAEAKAAATSQLLDAMDRRTTKLSDQVQKLRKEADVRVYEVVQWRSLATTILQHLDKVQSRYAREQVISVEDSVRRYAARQAPALSVSAAASSPSRREGEAEEQAMEANRHMWSRKAQAQQPLKVSSAKPRTENSTGPM
ncbi:hypothetical protein ABB37_01856 [Leptomonas pyrrhocoris]|uniref:Uncharacterized protein n=1 Tax=Leptomonas pyrrhocoris TaxID=157538 RepID=A0A0N0VCM2_LEPPY|nr:hypothetical protein ABB37_09969 [Leptomonas pyrrhocoris]XP_015661992.1 hypothetical protein ABB37_01856 [Leptomonas pyrrhocoris]KPA73252.1 hypothetical protein ABB37_09969 [Leptomonas pyrrhocoris]KPA83553.1 hypothetical protein ABB37_01856 [Leptomonas pyrrhocoris]|eukprot:XP_015651691.1 hypothetical protein ABB37_09969 [Leptomonas pyrrhocoris]